MRSPWKSLFVLVLAIASLGCGDDEDVPAPTPADGEALTVTLDEVWRGHFGTTALEWKNVPLEERGPSVTMNQANATVVWSNAVFQDCKPPTALRVTRAGQTLTLTLESVDSKAACEQMDVIAHATTTFPITPAGEYQLVVETTLTATNKGVQNGKSAEFTVTAP